MSGAIAAIIAATSASTAATSAAIAGAAAQRKYREEEQMSGYKPEDLAGWEFKIVRANTAKFRSQEAINRLCQEEAKAGWEMLEKFDDQRIRFKRRVERRSMDPHVQIDPYRTNVGVSGNVTLVIALGLALVVAGAVLLLLLNS